MRPEHWLFTIPLRLRSLFRWAQADLELDDELRDHLERKTGEYIVQGMTQEEARRRARLDLGGVERVKEECREARRVNWIQDLIRDLHFGLRMLRKSPGFTAVAVVTLALGIGANTAIFSLVNAIMLRPLSVENPRALVQILTHGFGATGSHFSFPAYEGLRDRNQVFLGTAAVFWLNEALLDAHVGDESQNLTGQLVSGNFFSLLGLRPAAGRLIVPADDHIPGGNQVAVLSFTFWQQRFGGDPAALGKRILLRRTPFTIIGVAPPAFPGISPGRSPDVYLPFATEPIFHDGKTWLDKPAYHWLQIFARLRPGVHVEQAQAEMESIYAQMLAANVKSEWSQKDREAFLSQRLELTTAASGLDDQRREYSQPLFLLAGMVAVVLLIACANVASMFMARCVTRCREMAVRLTLGARRRRLIRQLMSECVLFGLAGGTLGLVLSSWLTNLLVFLVSSGPAHAHIDAHPDIRVLGFTIVLSLLTVLLFGLAPAWRASGVSLSVALKEKPRALTSTGAGLRFGKLLVISQVTLSVLLVFLAGLLAETLRNLEVLDPGFNRDHVLLFSVNPTLGGFKGEQVAQLYRDVLEHLRHVPGIASASYSEITPVWGGGYNGDIRVQGYTPRAGQDVIVNYNIVSPGFFRTLETPVLMGRDFGPQDSPASPKVALINRAMARHFFGEQNPIGKKFGLEGNVGVEFEIVGVVGDAKYLNLREEPPRTFYLDGFQGPLGTISFEVRTLAEPSSQEQAIRTSLKPILGGSQLYGFKALEQQVIESLSHEQLVASLSALFALLALLLAAVGLYGIMAYGVEQRTNEIGIRMALGAQRASVLQLVLGQGIKMALLGIILGGLAALASARLLSSLLFGVTSADPRTFLCVLAVMALVALAACYIPARRATCVDPMIALRYE